MKVGAYTATEGGALLVIAIMLPVIGMLAIFALGLRRAERIAYVVLPTGLVVALTIAVDVARSGAAVTYVLGAGNLHSASRYVRRPFGVAHGRNRDCALRRRPIRTRQFQHAPG